MTSNKVQLWIETNGGKSVLQLPVNPEKITVKDTAHTDTVHVGGLGDVVIPGSSKAKQISFSSIFPAHYFQGCAVEKPMPPHIYIMVMEFFVRYGTVFKFRVTGRSITMNAIVDSFQYTEKGGDPGTFEYSITLKEYRSVKPRQIDVKNLKVPKATTTRVSTKVTPKTYTVVAGDCLWNIAKKYYGDGSKYTKIRDANKDVIAKHGSNPNMIWPGDVLKIP